MNKIYFRWSQYSTFILISVLSLVAYLSTKTLISIGFLTVIPLVYVGYNLQSALNFKIKLKYWRILLLYLIFVLAFGNLYNLSFVFDKDLPSNFLGFNKSFLWGLLTGGLSTALIYLSSFSFGFLFIRILKIKNLSFFKRIAYSLSSGFFFLSFLYLVLAWFGVFTKLWVFAVTFLPTLLIFKKAKLLKQARDFAEALGKTASFSRAGLGLGFLILLFASAFTAQSVTGFIEGPDGLRTYLNIAKFIAENSRLPNPSIYVSIPFPTEVLISFSYILGGIPSARVFINSFYFLVLLSIYLVSKKIGLKNFLSIGVLAVAVHPILIYLSTVEFKTDLFLAFILLSAFLLALDIKEKRSKISLVYLLSLILGFAFIIKYSAVFFALPLGLYALFTLVKRRFYKVPVALAFHLLPLALWLIFYRPPLPFIGQAGLYKDAYRYEMDPNYSFCSKEINKYELEEFYNLSNTTLYTLTLPFVKLFLPGSSRSALSSLNDTGEYYVIFLFLFIFIAVGKRRLSKKSILNLDALVLVVLSSFVLWASKRPDAVWYNLPAFLLLILYLLLFLEKNVKKKNALFLKRFFLIIAVIRMIIFITIDQYVTYIPANVDSKILYEDIKAGIRQRSYVNFYNLGKKVANLSPDNKGLILYSPDVAFYRLNYFFPLNQERILYFRALDPALYATNEGFEYRLLSQNLRFGVYLKAGDSIPVKCIRKSHARAKELFDKYGTIVMENENAILYFFN